MELKNIINKLKYTVNCLESYESLIDLPNCNDCGKIKSCEYRPGWGEQVRINCPLWEKEEEKK